MDALKLLIADSNEEFAQSLSAVLSERYQVFVCASGREALDTLRREQCGILVLDPILPELDGISLLMAAAEEGLHPMVLVVTGFLSRYLEDMCLKLGVNYVIRKPAQPDVLARRVDDLSLPLAPAAPSPRSFLSDLLLSLNLATKHNGFDYLREAILLAARDPGQPVTKVLYPAVAERCGCTGRQVERSIRSALEVAWDHRDEGAWKPYFTAPDRRPTNAAFISRLAEELRLSQQAGLVSTEEP